jgi:hypothetical protein
VFSCLECGTVEGQSEMRMRMVSSPGDRVVSGDGWWQDSSFGGTFMFRERKQSIYVTRKN